MTHFGDPCIHCGIPHDEVPVGHCVGDPSKAIPIAFKYKEIRPRAAVRHITVLMSTGEKRDTYYIQGYEEPPYSKGLRHDDTL
jgi:hypothetical protein